MNACFVTANDKIRQLTETLKEVPLDYTIDSGSDVRWGIADMCEATPRKLYIVDTRPIDKRYGNEYFIAEFEDRFECEWTQGSGSEPTLTAAIENVYWGFCDHEADDAPLGVTVGGSCK